ncbi:hypothetical protein EGT74_24425 [Chitinophaga lutea]|uniref:AraC-type arabinose-binding/dimerisation domain-containing protein n=1 Tax=Chitinophaga lutea TaxID=2488634 RepID=A0A3N4PA57_9BACT|nr:hypothetical protein [Chitinophaga lutea]RPE05533.1 hypothetical protein EGT74_24425 [Chitinophaga lutea]
MIPYLTRYTLIETSRWQLCLHIFHRSDWTDDLHDHPWDFVSLLLWRGYIEETPDSRRRYYPGAVLIRRAEHVHRVELLNGKKAVTLVWMGKRRRMWGFWEKQERGNRFWVNFLQYFRKYRC